MKSIVVAIGIVLCLTAPATEACAGTGRPPMFEPITPPNWSYQQKQDAYKALDVLFDECPSIARYMTDIQRASMGVLDNTTEVGRESSPSFWKAHNWSKVLTLDIDIVPHPTSKLVPYSPLLAKRARIASSFSFYMGAGDDPGIWVDADHIEYDDPSKNPGLVCGSSNMVRVPMAGVPSMGIPPSYDLFIPAAGMKVVQGVFR